MPVRALGQGWKGYLLKPLDEPSIRTEFDSRRRNLDRLRGEAEFILKEALGPTYIKVHSIVSRLKDVDSFIEKARRKNYEHPFDEI
jgi:ppGpp synthetase/RelA/SpoT-type nucleotidyltranferase